MPAWPFGYWGTEHEIKQAWDDLPPEQKRALVSLEFTQKDFDLGKAASRSKEYLSLTGFYGHNVGYLEGVLAPGAEVSNLVIAMPARSATKPVANGVPERLLIIFLPETLPRPRN